MVQLFGFRVNLDFRELYTLHIKVKIAQPVVQVLLVLFFNPTKFVELLIHSSKQHGHLEAPLIQLEFRIHQREDPPCNNIVLWNGVTLKKNKLKN